MKRLLPVLLLLLGGLSLNAAPVDVDEARALAGQFVQNHFEYTRQSQNLMLVYSQPAFYVFNVGDTGFVILSSDDSYRPVVGYSDEGVFNPNDIPPALQEFLDSINAYRTSRNALASLDVTADWTSLREHGRLVSRYGGREDEYLVETKWNQNYPYNYCCPVADGGPGGHVYAGCVATAAAQVMKYWNHPLQGLGSHTYTPEDHPEYGPLTANFGETVYDWDHMPATITASSPIEEIEAVATLIYHAGVSVDMNYRPSSSGAVTSSLCTSMPEHFYYTNQMAHHYREDFTHDSYMEMITESIDMRWPMVHRGGGHAYVLDGYNDEGLVHFNWGWSGNSDGWFDIDNHNYTDTEGVIMNYVPAAIYSATPNNPTNLQVTPATNGDLTAAVSWNNPVTTLTNQSLAAIDQIVVMRDNDIVYTEDNVTPGAAMSIVDTSVPVFSSFTYRVFAVVDGQRGKSIKAEGIHVGPMCEWKFVVSSSNMQGWRGSRIVIYDFTGAEANSVTVTNSSPTVVNANVPLGLMKMAWELGESIPNDFTITINVKDPDNNSVYNYSGNILSMPEGVFFEGNNGCGLTPECGTPTHLTAMADDDDEQTVILQWDGVDNYGYGYLIFRDDKAVAMTSETTFRDENLPIGGHCYTVATLCDGGMNGEYSNMACGTSGGCHPARHLNFEMTNNFKCKLTWDRPSPDDGLSGYIIYRKKEGEEYDRIKICGANATSYTDNTLTEEGDYYYQVFAHYSQLDCDSYPAAYIYDENQYYLHFLYSFDGVNESADGISIYPNPTAGVLHIEAPMMQAVKVYNMLGQQVLETQVNGDAITLNLSDLGSGMFMVMVQTANGLTTRKVSVIE